jgi:SPFH domain / Band 7 family
MSSDGKEPGAVWQAPKNSQWQLARQAMDQPHVVDRGDYESLPEEDLPESDLGLSTPTPIEEEPEPTPAKKGLRGGILALVKQLEPYTTFFLIPLAFFLFFSLIVLPITANRHSNPVWPFLILFVVITLAQGITAYFQDTNQDTDNGFWIATTFFGLCLFLLVSCFALAGLLPSLVLLLVLIGISVLLARSYLHRVSTGYVAIVYRFGKYKRTLYPGLNVTLPIDKVSLPLNVGETQWMCPMQRVQLSHSEDVVLRATISYKLIPKNAYLAVTEVNQWEESLREMLVSSLQTIATTFMPEDFVAWPQGRLVGQLGQASEGAHWDQVNAYLFQHLHDRAAMWGVQVKQVRIRDVTLVSHSSTLVDREPMPISDLYEPAPKSSPGRVKNGGQKEVDDIGSQPEDPTQADVPAPVKVPKEEVLIKAYKEVQNGKITDPETIRSIAQKFVALAADREKRDQVSFDADRAASNLFEQAKKYEEMNALSPVVERTMRKRTVE